MQPWREPLNMVCGRIVRQNYVQQQPIVRKAEIPVQKYKPRERSFTLVCIIVPFAVAALILLTIFEERDRPWLWIPKGLAAICFVFGLIGMATGLSAFIDKTGYTPGAAAVLTIIAVILNLIGGVITGLVGLGDWVKFLHVLLSNSSELNEPVRYKTNLPIFSVPKAFLYRLFSRENKRIHDSDYLNDSLA